MVKLVVDSDKYGYQCDFSISEAYNSAVKDLVRKRFDQANCTWEEFVFGTGEQLVNFNDIEAIESQLLANGYRFEPSAISSSVERPEAYKDSGLYQTDFSFEHAEAPTAEPDTAGRELRG